MRGEKLTALLLLLMLASGCRMLSRTSSPPPIDEDDAPHGFAMSDLRPKNLRENFRKATGRAPNEDVARGLYEQADALFQQASDTTGGKRSDLFAEAAEKYAAAAEKWPDSMLQEDSLFMSGESLFFADHYCDSQKAFDRLIKEFPNTRHIDRVDARRFDIAQYWLAMHRDSPRSFVRPNILDEKLPTNDTFGNAVRVFDKVRLDDPTGRLADDATMAAGSAYFAKADYAKADQFFADLRNTYPESEHQFEAAMLSVKAKLQLYQGSDYDSQDLEASLKLIEMMFTQFPQQAAQEREYLEDSYKDIRVMLAARDWETAEFYDYRQEYGAAKYYYSKVIRDFADTSLASDAQTRLAAIEPYPDKPEKPLNWLVGNLPERQRQQGPLITGNPLRFIRR